MPSIKHCPACGADIHQPTLYCRRCGADIRAVQMALDKPDITTGAAGRDEVLRAIADKVREMKTDEAFNDSGKEILSEVEKLLQSPEEKRLKQIRDGIGYLSIGLGIALYYLLREVFLNEGSLVLGAAIVALMVGLAHIINGVFFSIAGDQRKRNLAELRAGANEPIAPNDQRTTQKSLADLSDQASPSVTEGTTRELQIEPRAERQ
ncbi:MAG TPA: hypothetical protein VJ810_10920 [Blastocatellia bacterium]|nr:hypothetical protein [Blastocatellia bacterium]